MADLAQSLLLLIILLSLMMIIAGDAEMGGSTNHSYFEDCPVTSCEKHGQQIRFPFRNKDHQLPKCGYPGFDVSCKGKQMVLQLPLSGDFFVEGIDYGSQIVRLADPNGCNPRRLLNLKLSSLSPLQILYGYERDYGGLIIYVDNVTYVNCSTSISSTDISYNHFDPIPCLSGWGRYFYSTRSSYRGDVLPRTCDTVKTNMLSLPYYYSYIPFIPNISSSIFMKWESPDCRNCEISGEGCRLDTTTNGTTACFPFPPPPHRKGRKSRAWMKVVIGSSAVFGTVLLSGLLLVVWRGMSNLIITKRVSKNPKRTRDLDKFLKNHRTQMPQRYSYSDIRKMTDNLKSKLGEGGFGSVFRGKLLDGRPVAVKILSDSKGKGEDFINEVAAISRTSHVNIVRLVGFCFQGSHRALVYEFMANGSLEKFIFDKNPKQGPLGWEKLFQIAVGIARGLEYLHRGCNMRILHFDIKPHNILLDHDFCPKISDFGLAKLCPHKESIVSMTAARGTMGYIAPEVIYRRLGGVSQKSDVYSYGMLLLEMVGGRKNIDAGVENTSEIYFPDWIYNRLNKDRNLQLGDCIVGTESETARKLIMVGLWCIQTKPMDRPTMSKVVEMLEGNLQFLQMPPKPFLYSLSEAE